MDVKKLLLQENVSLELKEVARHITKSKKCVIITGAGISVSGGIPDFRSKDGGLYEMVKKQFPGIIYTGKDLFDSELIKSNEALKAFNIFMGTLKELIGSAVPTPTHVFLKKFAEMNKLTRIYTQNIDDLEQRIGLNADWKIEKVSKCATQVVQLHGTMSRLKCCRCTKEYPFTTEYCGIFKSGEAPLCPNCENQEENRVKQGRRPHPVGKLIPMVLLYGDEHPNGVEISQLSAHDQSRADCLLIMGTSLKIPGVKTLIKKFARAVHDRNGHVIMVNKSDVVRREWNGFIDYQVEGDCDEWIKIVEGELAEVQPRDLRPKSASIHVETQEPNVRMSRSQDIYGCQIEARSRLSVWRI
ncbi:hypothetical protein Glove_428g90 [Diversispora epigaea]|uniref:Deacetylase sirtuin-type domain-containing protein n=1 Tax=Diversispora epigaea TaxID=1348612 RepID=A0A397GZ58_9GLOM|nr:hypothetical protein Glove_428g90 [Diversispora epigaea]